MRRPVALAASLLLMLAASAAEAVDLAIDYGVLQRAIEEGLLQEGRYYVTGGPGDDCAYTFLEKPRLGASGARLALTFHLSGRAGVVMLGRCVGPSDAFDVTLTGSPQLVDGVLSLGDPSFSLPSRPAYEQLLAPILTDTIADALRFDLAAEIQRFTQAAAQEGYRLSITELTLTNLRVGADRIEVEVDFKGGVTQ
jgi:hypothetical protein